ncbi:hypothetical protein DPMN_059093 [Dreissena polymorpha]|uniref:Uncharacterized protein n=1 Tax=Dreissena polymorpha TaxID=45954 RepID=A0A9D4C3B2_DREPO|nr:hypothetical protein DPMN_059093 [Dreissena polymorpha]
MILKSHKERQSYGPDKLVSPARQPASQPASPPAFANLITSFFLRKTWLKSVNTEEEWWYYIVVCYLIRAWLPPDLVLVLTAGVQRAQSCAQVVQVLGSHRHQACQRQGDTQYRICLV